MVAIKAAAINRLLTDPGNYHAYLVFGMDEGLINERAKKLSKALAARASGPAEEVHLLNDDIAAQPERLGLDLKTISMFGERKVIRLTGTKNFSITDFQDLLNETPFEADLIIEAGDLKKNAKLRKIFEQDKGLAAIACYHDKKADITSLIDEVLESHSLTIDGAARNELAARLGADHGLSRSELEKLALYCLKQDSVSINDIDAVLGDMSEITLDNIISAALLGRPQTAQRQMQRALAEGTSPTVIFLTLLRQLNMLHKGALEIAKGATIHQVAKNQQPPLFYERRDNFIQQLNIWKEDRLARAITKTELIMARARKRSHPELEEKELAALLLALAAFARGRS